jgi:hypothetical protein
MSKIKGKNKKIGEKYKKRNGRQKKIPFIVLDR